MVLHTIRDRWKEKLCSVVEQCGYVAKVDVKSMWVRSSAITDATLDLLGIHVTNSLHANATANTK